MRQQAAELAKREIIRLCHSGLESRTLRLELLKSLQTVIPFDYVYFSTTDPATQLLTSSVMVEQPPAWMMSVFLENEFRQDDFLNFRSMLRDHVPVGVLSAATRQRLHHSPRYREMLAPLGMGDELRAIFVTDAACWATLCLHRAGSGYTSDEADFLSELTAHIADGFRKALLLNSTALTTPDGPGVLIVADDLSVVAMTPAAEYWLGELVEMERSSQYALPLAARSVVTALRAIEHGMLAPTLTPKVRLRTQSGHWLVLYASRLKNSVGEGQISVIFEVAQPAEISPLIMQAYDLTKREGEVAQCVMLGWSTSEISTRLHISSNTVQDHLKAIFEKVNVNSRGELAGRIFTQQHQPATRIS